MTDTLPPGWVLTTLGEVFEIVGGATPSTGEPSFWGGDIPWLTPDDLASHDGIEVATGRRSITAAGYDSTSTHLLPQGAVLFSSRAPIGYAAIAAQPLCTNQGFKSLIPPEGVDSRYVYWYLRHATPAIREMGSGTTFKEMSKKRMASVPFVLAPLAEQQRIVAAIEEHFSRLDAVETVVADVHRRLDALRSVTMDRAFYGTETARTADIGDLAEVSGGIQKQPRRRPRDNAYPFLRVANVGRGQLDLTEVHEIELFEGEIDRFRLKRGDLLVVEGNGSANQIGRAALWGDEIGECVHQNHLIRVRPGNELLPEYLALCWNAPRTAQQVRAVASSTSGLYTLSTTKVKSVRIPVVPLPVQAEIVDILGQRLRGVEMAHSATTGAAAHTRALRRALLARAFAGRLVPPG